MAKVLAYDVQQIIEVPDGMSIAYGYTFARDTVEIFFRQGKLVRRVAGVDEAESEYIEWDFFHRDIKRFYENGVHPWFIQQFETFSEYGLSLTPGGPFWKLNRVDSDSGRFGWLR